MRFENKNGAEMRKLEVVALFYGKEELFSENCTCWFWRRFKSRSRKEGESGEILSKKDCLLRM